MPNKPNPYNDDVSLHDHQIHLEIDLKFKDL